jgi:hypothetical protein
MYKVHNRGSVIVIALWAIGIAAIVTSSIQVFAHRQSLIGIEVQDRIQARWAARAGVESSIAVMAHHTAKPIPSDAFAIIDELDYVSTGEVGKATWDIRHHVNGEDWSGPMDEHSKYNINSEGNYLPLILGELSFGVMEAIMDWKDEDNIPRLLGVERDYYLSLETSYEPRNGALLSIAELELIAGVMPDDVRGEDWDLDFRLDANENDGGESLPWDEPDEYLDGGWASMMTVSSVDGGATDSGEPRINLKKVYPETLQLRLGVDPLQAEALIELASSDDANLSDILSQSLRTISGNAEGVTNLTDDQKWAIFAETCLYDSHESPTGRMNINTIAPDLLYKLFPNQSHLVEDLLHLRESNRGGIRNPMDYFEISGIQSSMVADLYEMFDTKSNVYAISCLGKATGSGVEQEIIVIVDRSTLPVTILEYREQ